MENTITENNAYYHSMLSSACTNTWHHGVGSSIIAEYNCDPIKCTNLNRDRYIKEILGPEVFPLLRRISGAVFQQDNVCTHVHTVLCTHVSKTAQAIF